MEVLKRIKNYIYIVLLGLILGVSIISVGCMYKLLSEREDNNIMLETASLSTTKVNSKIIVDVKGEVKKPGVYELKGDAIVNDAIKMAGGLTKNAYTKNINLSKKIDNEMVIYVFNKKEIDKENILNDTTCTTQVIEVKECDKYNTTTTTIKTNSTSSNISTGVSTSKNSTNISKNTTTSKNSNSSSIITTNNIIVEDNKGLININTASKEELMTLSGIGSSKADAIITYRSEQSFNTIEDIMKVSGIGEAAFAKIKDNITVR